MKSRSNKFKVINLRFFLFAILFFISTSHLNAQLSYRVLFLGNSYTYYNNLPQLIHDVALSTGDTLIFDSHTPGGYQLVDHNSDSTSQNKIMAGNWDYVVLQGQSQEPVVESSQFNNGAAALHSKIKQYNPCAIVMPYMTWGRKNGDVSTCPWFPVMCTYQGMDTTIREAYLDVTSSINGEVSPVSIVWNHIRQNFSNIELYQPDESHPSTAGSYAAACCFYATIFKKDPTLITFDFGLDPTDAANIRNAAKTQVFDNLHLWNFYKSPNSNFGYQIGSGFNEVIFGPMNPGVKQTYFWDFGDGNTTSAYNPTHSYLANGMFTVSLTTTNCDFQGLHTSFTDTIIEFCSHTPSVYTTLPYLCLYDTLWTQLADSYQWFSYGNLIPETNQYLPNYRQYAHTGFTVISTINGCSELSQPFNGTAVWSGYYFDLVGGDPCDGDTVPFAVLHTSGALSGLENILWYKNDTLLTSMTNEDTLLITSSGKYECRVIDPNSNCPLDSTSYEIEYNCGVTGIEENNPDLLWTLFPNPASEIITISFSKHPAKETIEIYNSTGHLIKSFILSEKSTKINIADFANGLYIVRVRNNNQTVLKFFKL